MTNLIKGRVFDTGDTHGEIDFEKIEYFACKPLDFTMDDVLIINGDAGFLWYKNDNHYENIQMHKRLSELPFTVFVVLGNHENYDKFYELPISEKFGGKVRTYPLSKNVYYAERGEIYNINGKTFWCFGGGYSVDQFRRIKHLSWWEQELPTEEEMNYGFKKLVDIGNRVDYIITHDCPAQAHQYIPKYVLLGQSPKLESRNINEYFDKVIDNVYFKKWLCGHYHFDGEFKTPSNDKIRFLYHDIIELE